MRQKPVRLTALATAAILALCLLSGCASSGVKSTLSRFESACQTLNAKEMLACVDPTISDPLLSAMELLGIEDTSETLDRLGAALGLFGDAGEKTEELLQSIRITPRSYDFNSDKDRCTVAADFSWEGSESHTVTIRMVLKEETWYISGLSL